MRARFVGRKICGVAVWRRDAPSLSDACSPSRIAQPLPSRERQEATGADRSGEPEGSAHLGGRNGRGVTVRRGSACSPSDVCELGSPAVVANAVAAAIACSLP